MLTLVLPPAWMAPGSCSNPSLPHLLESLPCASSSIQRIKHSAMRGWKASPARRYRLAGHSSFLANHFPAPLPLLWPLRKPAGLVGLVLCCTFIRNPRPAFSFLRPMLGLVPLGLAPVGALGRFLMSRHATRPLKAALAESLAQVSASALRARLRAVLSVDVSSQLRSLNLPLLYVCASKDQVVPASAGKRIVQVYPGAQLVHIEAPHFLLQVAPRQAAGAIRAFVSALSKTL